jgi:hypothetical protein
VAKVEAGERRIDLVEFYWFMSACGLDPLVVSERLMQKWRTPRQRGHAKEGRPK